MTDVRRVSRRAPRSFHDVTGPDINLDSDFKFSELEAQVGCATLLGGCHVAPDRRPTEKQALRPTTDWRARLGSGLCRSAWST